MIPRLVLLSILLSLAVGLFMAVGCDELITQVNNNTMYDSTLGEDCKRCHGDDDKIIRVPQAQWENSRHASSELIEATIDYGDGHYLTSDCGRRCHTGEGFRNYVIGDSNKVVTQPGAINCFTCHLPHTGNYGEWSMDTLRGERETTDLGHFTYYSAGKSNMCAICHRAVHVPIFSATPGRISLDTIGPDGPHSSAQANMLMGAGGVRFGEEAVTNSHGTLLDTTKDGCLACHFGTGVGYDFGEHTFRLLDDNTSGQHVVNCNVTGCHTGLNTVDGLFDADNYPRLDSIRILGDSLRDLLLAFPILTGADTDTTDFYRDSVVPSDAAKILFNYLMYRGDGSRGVHNTKYTLQLLKESVARWDSVPRAAINPSVTHTCAGVQVDFENLSLGSVYSSSWDFGDGLPPLVVEGAADASHTYSKHETFVVTLTIQGGAGTTSIATTIVVDTVPNAQFVMSLDTTFVDSVVTFTDQSTRAPISWAWDFGDAIGTSAERNPQYAYIGTGSFEVRLIAANDCGVDTMIDTIVVITPPAPVMGRR